MKLKLIIIFGGADPEAGVAETVATAAGLEIAFAANQKGRVSPGSAYDADRIILATGEILLPTQLNPSEVAFFECSLPGIEPHVRFDHHRPGDTGYGRPPAEYWPASSLGQLCGWLGLAILISHRDEDAAQILGDREGPQSVELSWSGIGDIPGYRSIVPGLNRWPTGKRGQWEGLSLPFDPEIEPLEALHAAAADHCLAAAYRGECPGINPDELMRWRVASRAAHQGRAPEAILRDIETARVALRAHVLPQCDYCGRHQCGAMSGSTLCEPDEYGHPAPWYHVPGPLALFQETVPELPEAACREGVAFAAPVRDRDGRKKLVLQAASPEQVRGFMDQAPCLGLTNVYGDPERGFAGGYSDEKS